MATTAPEIEEEVLNDWKLSVASYEGRQECVLLIEDSEDSMALVQFALQKYGAGRYRLTWAGNLIDGLERLQKDRVDVVLLDLGLPDSSGPVSYAWVRQIAPSTPILVLTGDTSQETEFSVLASGAEDYLVKSQLSGPSLLEAIRAALFEKRA